MGTRNKLRIISGKDETPLKAASWKPAPLDKRKAYRFMAQARALEERLIKMSKSSDGYFWIGGPGEEAFNVPLGLLIKKGEGLDYDFLHFHYRQSATMLAMGMEIIDQIRQMANRVTDPFSGGRNFANHYSWKKWNVVPVTSPIEVQYSVAPGTALAQLRHGGDGITIVTGGDAGTAEADFPTCLNWSSRPGRELPILIIVTNNKYGISTPYNEVHADRVIARRAEPFGIKCDTVDGNDLVASYDKLKEAMAYVRKERKPFLLEAYVSRLHGHSSSSGALRVTNETDCLTEFEKQLVKEKLFTPAECEQIRKDSADEAFEALKKVRQEPFPDPATIYDHIFSD
ncbi:MAG TPA: thiamine pyrophosphate-dependent dehydrogenase E1 component subunit alpha [Bdellovibrionota bacterium]|nr:thiamine pyrophosphate-dependent dehydrogenase E1 component subunit alpha [Bdellovibrionota bacterium]